MEILLKHKKALVIILAVLFIYFFFFKSLENIKNFIGLNYSPSTDIKISLEGNGIDGKIEGGGVNKDEITTSDNSVRIPTKYACVGEFCDGSGYGDDIRNNLTVIYIPLITDGGDIGCNAKIFMSPHTVDKTSKVLEATYKLLFDIKHDPEIQADGFRNTVAAFDRVFFDSVTLGDGVAKVYLSGNINSPDTCADPEFKAQIETAAFEYKTVKSIEVYLNNKIFDWCTLDMSDGEGVCKNGPQLWKKNR